MDHNSHSKPESIPLHRVAVMRPFAQFLADVGVPVERELQRAGVPVCALEDVNNYIPLHRFWSFLVNTAHREGIEDLGFLVGSRNGADSGDPKLTSLLCHSPTLYQGLLKASELINKTVSHCHLGLIQPPLRDHAYFFHRPSCDAQNPAIDQIGWFGLTTLIGIVRVFAGPEWQPHEIGMMTHHMPCRTIREAFPATCMLPSQAYSYITLDKALLSLQPLIHSVTPDSSLLHYEPLSNDLAGSLKQILSTYIQEGKPSIELAAELCNTSKRSLQRKLAESGTRYSEVLDHALFHIASRMLQDPDMKVTDVARVLGYSDPTHFSRAFRRIAGVNPQAYRKAHLY